MSGFYDQKTTFLRHILSIFVFCMLRWCALFQKCLMGRTLNGLVSIILPAHAQHKFAYFMLIIDPWLVSVNPSPIWSLVVCALAQNVGTDFTLLDCAAKNCVDDHFLFITATPLHMSAEGIWQDSQWNLEIRKTWRFAFCLSRFRNSLEFVPKGEKTWTKQEI